MIGRARGSLPNRRHFGEPCLTARCVLQIETVLLGNGHPFLHVARANESPRRSRNHRERLNEAGMVDLFGMFRRRPTKRGAPGFARSHVDITALGDSMGEMLSSPVRDAPPMAREAPPIAREIPQPKPAVAPPAEKPRPVRAKTNGAAGAPRP